MGTKRVVYGYLFILLLFAIPANQADIVVGSGTTGFQGWVSSDLKNKGKPYWDNKSLDSTDKQQQKTSNVGFYLVGESNFPLDGGPDDALPYWGKTGKSKKKTGGNSDLNFFFQMTAPSNSVALQLEADPSANIDEFGWYDISNPSVLHSIFLGPESPNATDTFSPTSQQYGFYLKRGDQGIFYTQSSLNPFKDTSHQHFVVFQESATPSNEVYWIGIENRTRRELKGKEGGLGDYNDMLVRINVLPTIAVPEPSTVVLVLSSTLLMVGIRLRRR